MSVSEHNQDKDYLLVDLPVGAGIGEEEKKVPRIETKTNAKYVVDEVDENLSEWIMVDPPVNAVDENASDFVIVGRVVADDTKAPKMKSCSDKENVQN